MVICRGILAEPDVELSHHPAPIIQPRPKKGPSGRTGVAAGAHAPQPMPGPAACDRVRIELPIGPSPQKDVDGLYRFVLKNPLRLCHLGK